MIASPSALASVMPLPVSSVKKKRSRTGCESCKKLKIKCDELKPRCEYCRSTERECIYIPPKKIFRRTKKDIENAPRSELSVESYRCREVQSKSTLNPFDTNFFPNINWAPNGCEAAIDFIKFSKRFHETKAKTGRPYEHSLLVSQMPPMNEFEFKLIRLLKFFSSLYAPASGPFNEFLLVEVPALFNFSKVVRLGIYSFCCIHIWNPTDIDNPTISDFINTQTNTFVAGKSHNRMYGYDLTKGSGKNLYENTMCYFVQLVAATNSLIISHVNNELIQDEKVAKELLFAFFVMLIFFGMHKHVPLVKMDLEGEYSHDFDAILNLNNDLLTIGSTIKRVSRYVVGSLSPIRQEVEFVKSVAVSNTLASFPIISQVSENLDFYYHELYLYSDDYRIDADYLVLKAHLNLFQEIFSVAFLANRGLPFYKLYVVIGDDFRDLVRAKNPIALETLFVYSFICLSVRFCVFTDKNVWLDFMNWYKEWNFHVFGDWKYEMDKNLYYLKQDDTKDVRYYIDLDPLNIPQ